MKDYNAGVDLGQFHAELGEAAAALQNFARGPVRIVAGDIGKAFEGVGERIARTLAKAAGRGEVSLKRLAKVALEELAKIALDRIFPDAKSGGKRMPFFGARAAGGPVNVGGAYLVGERGPELFAPRQAGQVAPMAGAVSVHFHLGAGADVAGIARHQGQIAAAIARAVAYGRRNL